MSKSLVRRAVDVKPFQIGLFTFTATGLEVRGRPSFADWEGVGEFIKRSHRASGFWLADWLRYGEGRADWAERLSQAIDVTGLSEKTLKNVRAVGAIDPVIRREGVEFGLHAEVAGLKPEDQAIWLERAEEEGWDRRELRVNMRAARRTRIIEGQAALEGMYRVVYADPPWLYSDSAPPPVEGSLGKADRHYPGMTIDQLCKLPVQAHTWPSSVLFLWVTAPMLYENPGPREVIEAWGFVPKTGIVWDKVLGNYGHYVHGRHEHLLIATRGSCPPDRPTPSPDSVLTVRRSTVHSEKPIEARRMIEQLYDGPYLELFGRQRVEGWDVFGNDARLWAEEATA